MKKRVGFVLAVVLVMAFGTGVLAKTVYENIKAQLRPDFVIEIDGEVREFKNVNGERVYPILHDGTTYLPVRAIGEIMGKKVYWYEDEKRVELKDKDAKDEKTTVTDADVIVDSADKTNNGNGKNNGNNGNDKADKVGYISEETAKKIALEKAGLKENEVDFIKVKFERDDGIYIYDVEFRKGFTEYNADIKADDGKIIEWDVDIGD